ncbi:MAG: Uncharacterized protein G01um101416_298 [Microgenomates group bacterium Gr01-1014_16]|nr:MAG: Uncharacterized protein G01um101416_298 [Microgenomates group bacterium Gr01-1014_16]
MWSFVRTGGFDKKFSRLPREIQKKFLKQMRLMQGDFRHPSLHTKKKSETTWEARVDIHYRFTFEFVGEQLVLKTIGMHDEGLGKK